MFEFEGYKYRSFISQENIFLCLIIKNQRCSAKIYDWKYSCKSDDRTTFAEVVVLDFVDTMTSK